MIDRRPAQITWTDQAAQVRCRVCGETGAGRKIAEVVGAYSGRMHTVDACGTCGSLDILDQPLALTDDPASTDAHVEYSAGIGTMLDLIAIDDPSSIRRMADIGCGYGFAVAAARDLHGWEAIGVEPSLAGRRGRTELGVEIIDGYFDPADIADESLDLILLSEVIEHIPDPLTFLRSVLQTLAPEGILRITTPAREIVHPSEDRAVVLGALSTDFHCFAASADGLSRLLQRAGYTHLRVWRKGGTLHADASRSERALAALRHRDLPPHSLEVWYRQTMLRAPNGSALRLGMAERLLRSLVARGDFAGAKPIAGEVDTQLRARYGVSLDEPAALLPSIASTPPWLGIVPGFAYALGMCALLDTGDAERAANLFELGGAAVDRFQEHTGVIMLDMAEVRRECLYHHSFALTRTHPDAAVQNALRLSADDGMTDTRRARLFVELASLDHDEAAAGLLETVERTAPDLATSSDATERQSGLDAVWMMGILAARAEHHEQALRLFDECTRACLAAPTVDSHALQLARASQAASADTTRIIIQLLDTSGPVGDPLPAPTPALLADLTHPSPLPVVHVGLDSYWTDAYGTFVEGWVHAGGTPITQVEAEIGNQRVTAQCGERLDVRSIWPEAQALSGFAAYMPGARGHSLTLRLATPDGTLLYRLQLPVQPLPIAPEERPLSGRLTMSAWSSEAPPGPVLAIGVRAPSHAALAELLQPFAGREIICVDVHEGIGVDRIVDAHRLSHTFAADSFAIVYSSNVLEHVTQPWLVALECSRVLKDGGLALHAAPWVWPTHASPNDFWRFSPAGLEQLFSPAVGFEVIHSGSSGSAVVTPHPSWRDAHVRMPTMPSDAESWIVARKVSEPDAGAAWPYEDAAGLSRAQHYPVEGLSAPIGSDKEHQ